jgi:Fe-S-cluster containining protein
MKDYECQKCGNCCKSFTILLDLNQPSDLKSFVLKHIKKLLGINLKNQLGPTEVIQHGICEYLDEKTNLCTIHAKREGVCKAIKFNCFRDGIPFNFIKMIRRINAMTNNDPQKTSEILNDILIHTDEKLTKMEKEGKFADIDYIS